MNERFLSAILALVRRDLRDAALNPTVVMTGVVTCLLAAAFTACFREASEGDFMGAVLLVCAAPAMVGGTMLIYVVAEERERGALLTLYASGVSVGQVAAAKLASAFVASMLVSTASYAVAGLSADAFPAFLLASACSAAAILPLALAGAFVSRDQMRSGLWCVPVVFAAVVPFLGLVSEGIHAVTAYFPAGAAVEVAFFSLGPGAAMPSWAIAVEECVWIAVGMATLALSGRRLARELQSEMMRENG